MKGYEKAYFLTGGWDEWVAAGYPVEGRDKKK
jgi:3-mercaptopyruvate sulfurtransferase SseA